ncbi:MAG: TolC family outer membrane protein [Magnetococcales bacterium]|nr:TolC family outer membrane protein [Magnetococcales bacterium]
MAMVPKTTPYPHKRISVLIACCVAASFQAVPAWSMTLREAASMAVKTYPDVQAAEEYGKALDQKLRQAWAGYLPRIDFSTGYGTETSDNATTRAANTALGRTQHDLTLSRGEASLIAKQNLFDGHDVRSKVAQAKAQLQSAQARLELTADTVALLAVQSYIDVVTKHIQLELIKDNVLLHQRIMSKVQKKFEGGAGTEADVNQAKSRTFLASANHASNQAGYKNAQAKFSEIVGVPPLTEQEMIRPLTPEKLLPKSVEEAIERALLNNWELESARLNVAAAEAGVEIAKAGLYPKVDMELSSINNANQGGSAGHGQSLTAMVRMNYNVFGGGADLSKIQEQRNMLEQARQLLEKTQRNVEETTRETWNKMTMAQNRISFMKQHYEVSRRVTASYHDQFKMGKRTLLDVLNSENELFAAKNGLLFEELNYVKSAFELFAKMGTLRDALDAEAPPTPEQKIRIDRDADTKQLEPEAAKAGEDAGESKSSEAEQAPADAAAPAGAAPPEATPAQDKKGSDKPKRDPDATKPDAEPKEKARSESIPSEPAPAWEDKTVAAAADTRMTAPDSATKVAGSDSAMPSVTADQGGEANLDRVSALPKPADLPVQTLRTYQQLERYAPGQETEMHSLQHLKEYDPAQVPEIHSYQHLEKYDSIQQSAYQVVSDTALPRQ